MSTVRTDLVTTARALRIVAATMAYQPGKARVSAMLCDATGLPTGNWVKAREFTYRNGAGAKRTEEIRRARMQGCIHAYRCLRSMDRQRSVWFAITPFASKADTEASLPKNCRTGCSIARFPA
jgi:hypothetical protein